MSEAVEPLLWTAQQVAEALNVKRDWVYDEAEAGRLPSVKLGRRHLRFRPQDIRALIDERVSA